MSTIRLEDLYNNIAHPAHCFTKDGMLTAIAGPLVSFSKKLIKKIDKSRSQNDPTSPFISVIDTTLMMGDLKQNLKDVSNVFQPSQNTRFSGVLLVSSLHKINERCLEFNFISNPFARYPITKKIEMLFS